jgi:hypothetical protein
MKLKTFLSILFLFNTFLAFSQKKEEVANKGYKLNNNFDLAIGANVGQYSGAISWVHLHGIGKRNKFKIGYGLRFTTYTGNKLNYITAPAKLTSGKTGPSVLFSEINAANYDTLYVAKAQHNSLNASINLQYSLSKNVEIGFNIDALGVSFGAQQTGKFISTARPANISESQTAKPTTFNALLISDNDLGMLNSELYAKYWLTSKLAIKGGLGFLFTEYTTTNKLVLNNDRWRNKSLMPMIGISYAPFKKY